MDTERSCTVCKIVKPFSEFRKNKKGKYGIDAQCKKCRYEKHSKPYYLANKEKCHANANKWAKNNRETINNQARERYAEDPRKVLDKMSKYRSKNKTANDNYRARHVEKIRAQAKLQYHVKHGNVIKPNKCTFCENTNWIEAHHHDYSKALDVVWVCRQCHVQIHKRMEKSHVHRERPSLETPKGDAMVRPTEETCGEEV